MGGAAPGASHLEAAVQSLLDRAQVLLAAGRGVEAFRLLTAPFSQLWTEARSSGREAAMRELCLAHPLQAIVRQDPFTHRAAAKPRGYAGDAVMMDYIYRGEAPAGTTALGHTVFGATTRASTGLSVRYRRQLLRSLIDETAVAVDGARILSVASGHARELDGSLVGSPFFRGEFVALDQDPLSCAEVARSHAGHRVRVVNRGIKELLNGAADVDGEFDLVYSAGLYDYLPDAVAVKLTRHLLARLRPGGRLLIGNFVPTANGRAYMEIYMDWALVLRDTAAMEALARRAGAPQAAIYLDPHRNVVYADMIRPS